MNEAETIQCPRCGYDLSGTHGMATATGAPEGICSECGLAFAWAELLSGRLHLPPFSYEHGGWLNVVRFARTFGRSLTGWRLWGRLKMEHEIRVGRLVVFAVVTIFAIHVTALATVMLTARFGRVSGWAPRAALSWQDQWLRNRSIAMPPPPPLPVGAVWFHCNCDYGSWPVTTSDVLDLSLWPYGPVARLDLPWLGALWVAVQSEVLFGAACSSAGIAIVLLVLRQTRRQFRLRITHVVRGACLIAPVLAISPLVVALIQLGVIQASLRFRGTYPSLVEALSLSAAGLELYWLLWWWAFTRRYLRAPHAFWIAASGVSIGGLVFLLGAIAVGSSVLWSLVG